MTTISKNPAPRPLSSTSAAAPSTPAAAPAHAPASPAAPVSPYARDAFVDDASARSRMMHATGRGTEEQILGGMVEASRQAHTRVDWAHPTETLRHHSQIDANDATTADEHRCGATALVGGLVLSGPEAPGRLTAARSRVETRLDEVERDLRSRQTFEWQRAGTGVFSGMTDVHRAREALRGLPSDTSTWTHQDLSRFEEATYRLGHAEQALHGRTEPGLTGPEMLRLRDTVWGDYRPRTSDGQPVDVIFAGSQTLGGASLNHFVLGTDASERGEPRSVVYDPWPGDDGLSYVRTPGQPEQQLINPRAEDEAWSPRQPGVDIDAWRGLPG